MTPYRTVGGFGQEETVIRKSRFIGACTPCETQEAALAFLEARRELHRDATHHCYAYIIGQNEGVMRYSDDGEPGGTAGMPILEVLRARGLVNCAVVVTRYFGGILLGAGGLTRAYSHACASAVNAAGIVVMRPLKTFLLELPYEKMGRFDHEIKERPIRIDEREYASMVVLTLTVPAEYEPELIRFINELTGGQAEMLPDGDGYGLWQETGGV